MADLTITTTNMIPGSGAVYEHLVAGAAITIGQLVYKNATDDKAYLAQNDGTAAEATIRGIAVSTAAAANQIVTIQTGGTLAFGAILTEGEIYGLSSTAGGIAPEADSATSNDYISIVGVATSTSNLLIKITNSGAQIA